MNENEPSNLNDGEALPPHEETAIDALLSEAVGNVQPRDFAPMILTRLRNESAASVRPVTRSTSQTKSRSSRRLVVASFIAAIAAVFAGMFFLRPDPVAPKVLTDKSTATPAPVQPLVTKDNGQPESKPSADRPPLRGVPMTMPELARVDGEDQTDSSSKTVPPKPLARPLSVALVSRQVEEQFNSYWASIGIRPSDVAGNEELAARWSESLGVAFSSQDVAGIDSVAKKLDNAEVAATVARRWLNQITEGGLDGLEPDAKSALVGEVSGAIAGDKSFGKLFAAWMDGSAETSPAFWTAMGFRSSRWEDGTLARRLASVSLDADLRCIRCHDALIEGSGRQRDHWSLVAVLRSGLQNTSNPTFYDAIDGSKRVARPGVAWIGDDVDSLDQWSRQLADPGSVASRRLAGGVVNSLWQLVHGRPLQGSVVDPVSAPHSEALSGLENELGDDLRRSDFDLGRTLALILNSPATRRSVPTSLQDAWVIDDVVDRAAAEAFAAARPMATRLPIAKRLDQTMRAIGATLGSGDESLLAQLGNPDKNVKAKSDAGLSWDFPDRADSLPLQWLGRIEGLDQQIDHLAHLAGKAKTPDPIREAAAAMKASEINNETLLHRVWWLLR